MNQREEVCKLANEIAKKRGGQPYQYMGEAWEKVRQKQGLSTKRVPINPSKSVRKVYDDDEDEESSDGYFGRPRLHRGNRFKDKAKEVTRKSIRTTMDSVNFAKAPKDSPKEVFGSFNLKRTDPIPMEFLKNIFKIW